MSWLVIGAVASTALATPATATIVVSTAITVLHQELLVARWVALAAERLSRGRTNSLQKFGMPGSSLQADTLLSGGGGSGGICHSGGYFNSVGNEVACIDPGAHSGLGPASTAAWRFASRFFITLPISTAVACCRVVYGMACGLRCMCFNPEATSEGLVGPEFKAWMYPGKALEASRTPDTSVGDKHLMSVYKSW